MSAYSARALSPRSLVARRRARLVLRVPLLSLDLKAVLGDALHSHASGLGVKIAQGTRNHNRIGNGLAKAHGHRHMRHPTHLPCFQRDRLSRSSSAQDEDCYQYK